MNPSFLKRCHSTIQYQMPILPDSSSNFLLGSILVGLANEKWGLDLLGEIVKDPVATTGRRAASANVGWPRPCGGLWVQNPVVSINRQVSKIKRDSTWWKGEANGELVFSLPSNPPTSFLRSNPYPSSSWLKPETQDIKQHKLQTLYKGPVVPKC